MKTKVIGIAVAALVLASACGGSTTGTGGGSATGGGTASGGGGGSSAGGGTGGGSAAGGGAGGGSSGGGAGGGSAAGGGSGGGSSAGGGSGGGGGSAGGTGGAGGGAVGGGAGGGTAVGGGTGGSGGGSAGGGAGGGSGARTITINVFNDFLWEGGDAGRVPASDAIQMRVVAETDAGVMYFNSVVVDAGVYAISGVPAGRALLEYNRNRFLDSEGDVLDLGSIVSSRPNLVAADAGTRLHVKVSNLTPWDLATDQLNYNLVNTHSYYNTFTQYASPLPDGGSGMPYAGATTLDINTGYGQAIIDSNQGDILRFAQLRYAQTPAPGSDAGVCIAGTPVAYGVAAPFSMVGGATNNVSAVMLPVTPVSSVAIDLRRGEAAAMRTLVHPNAQLTFSGFYAGAIPFGYAKGAAIEYDGYPTILQVYGPIADTSTLALTLPYSSPFPTSWPMMGGLFAQFTTQHPLPTTQNVLVRHNIVSFDEGSGFSVGPHRPRLSPPLGVTVNGVSGDQTLTSNALTIAWGAPTVGTATYYRVNVQRLFLSGATPTYETVAFVITDRMSARIPPGVLMGPNRYVVQVFAVENAGNQTKSAPFRVNTFPFSYAGAGSGTLILP